MQKKLHLLIAMMVFMASSAMAQITTSALSGNVVIEGSKEDVIGATVQVVHEPSGTKYAAVTNADGEFNIRGMRSGGPYTVTVSYVGMQTKVFKDVTLSLGETYSLPVWLSEDAKQLGEVVVSAKATKFANEKTGASTNIDNAAITNMPTVSRSITDFTRLSPYGGNGMTFGGTDGRTANFTVDGASFNNDFGLSSDLPGGGNPISIDAIEEMQVVISPYDVRQSGFIGGGVNAITKSGTNIFKGTAYVYHKNENLRGDAVEGEQISGAREKDRTTTYGVTLGGPIIKNKLFFFVSGEMTKTPTVANRWRGSTISNGVAGKANVGTANADNYISRASTYDLQQVSDYLMNKYGYDTGSYDNFPADESNYKLLARLDWNINNSNKLAVRYNFTKNRGWNSPNSSSMDGGTRMSGGRTSQYGMSYANSMYAIDNLVHSVSVDLNSRISNSVSNQFLATWSKKDDVRFTNSADFPFIDILEDNQIYISAGKELFTHNNAVHTTTMNAKDDVTWFVGNHKVMGGVGYEYQMADNMYMRNGTGYYRYSSLSDFLSGATPEIVNLTYGYNGETDPAARVRYHKINAYLQDEWDICKRFKLTYGLRIDDFIFMNSDLMTNNALLEVNYPGHGSMDTGSWPKNRISWSPRLGFVWDVLGNKSLKFRGGTGLFTGRLPLVFFTNMPTNSGMVQYNAQCNAKNAASYGYDMSTFAGDMLTSVSALQQKLSSLGYPQTIDPSKGTFSSGMCGVDPNFKMPQVWKSSVAIDYQFPTSFPLSLTGEFIFNKNINSATIDDWSIPSVAGFAHFNGADNRPIYTSGYQNGKSLYVLTNTSKGYGWQASVTLNAQPWEWMDFMAAYTHSVQKELTSLPGSSASSVLNYIGTVAGPNPNNMQLHNALNVTPDRFIASLNLHDKCCNHYSIIYETWRGNYKGTYMTVNDVNGDGYNYDLTYIPTDAEAGVAEYTDKNGVLHEAYGQFRFATEEDKQNFMDYVHSNKYLSKHQGQYAEAYGDYSPWVHRVDVSYKHDFQINWGNTNHKLQLSVDLKNLMNIFNSSWGVMKYYNTAMSTSPSNNAQEVRIIKYEGVDAQGYAVYSTPDAINKNTETFKYYHNVYQCWNASIGLKYFFEGQKKPGCGCKNVNYDNDALNALMAEKNKLKAENADLIAENARLKNQPAKVETKVEKVVEQVNDKFVVSFKQNSAELSDETKAALDKIPAGTSISVVGATSPEGTYARNSQLSVQRANAVADYLKARGVNVTSAEGNDAARVAIVTIK